MPLERLQQTSDMVNGFQAWGPEPVTVRFDLQSEETVSRGLLQSVALQ